MRQGFFVFLSNVMPACRTISTVAVNQITWMIEMLRQTWYDAVLLRGLHSSHGLVDGLLGGGSLRAGRLGFGNAL
jgi:hypothetical protein